MDEKNFKPVIADDFELEVFEDEAENTEEDLVVRPYGYDPYVTPQPKPEKPPKYMITGIAWTEDEPEKPVYVVNSLVDASGVKMDLNKQFYNGFGEEQTLILDDKSRLKVLGELYTAERVRVYPEIITYPYFPEEGIYSGHGEKMKTMFEPKDILESGKASYMLWDKMKRPVFPLGGQNGFIVDANHRPIYPALAKGNSYTTPEFHGRKGMPVQPTTVNMFTKEGMPVYPYSTVDNRVFTEVEPVPVQPIPYQMEQPVQPTQPEQQYPYGEQQRSYYGEPQSQTQEGQGDWDEMPMTGDDIKEPAKPEKPWYKEPKFIGMIIGIVVLLILGIWGGFKLFGGQSNDFTLENDTVTAELEKDMTLNLEDFFGSNMSKEGLKEVTVTPDAKLNYNKNSKKLTTKGKDRVYPGTYSLEFNYKKEKAKATLIIEDTVAPEISGKDSVVFGVGKYSDKALIDMFDIKDEAETQVSVDTFAQNLLKEGTYKADITAIDASKNKTTKNVTITVQKTQQQIVEEEKKAEEAKRKAEEEAQRKAEEEARRKAEEEEAKRQQEACTPSLPSGAYTDKFKAYADYMEMQSGLKEVPFTLKEGQQLVVNEYKSNCDTPYWMISAE